MLNQACYHHFAQQFIQTAGTRVNFLTHESPMSYATTLRLYVLNE